MNIRIPKNESVHIANTKDIARIMRKILLRQNRIHRRKEYFWAIGLNQNHDIEYIELLAIGSSNKVYVDPVEIFSLAVSKKCKKLIVCHNHPSCNLKPSKEDLLLTKKIILGANTLNINLLDHIIICEEKGFTSMFELDNLEIFKKSQ